MSGTVLIGGVFDPLHAGHLAYIREAQTHGGDVLCAVSDSPKHPPLVPLDDRMALLHALGVSPLRHQPGDIPAMLEHFRPAKYIKGKDWEGKLPAEEVAVCERFGIQVVYTDTILSSSSALLADYERKRNAEKLAAFESWVSTQPPVIQPWTPVTDYSREAREAVEMPHANVIAEVFAGMSVLDYGCGFGYLVDLLKELGMEAHGWDPVYGPRGGASAADVVICREVLEHVPVRRWPPLLHCLKLYARQFIYVTTRFTPKPHLLDFDTSDDLDPTHISMLNQDFLRSLFVLEGCTRRADLEARLDHMKKGRVLVYEVHW